MKKQTKLNGPFDFDNCKVFFDFAKGEFWDPILHQYIDHEIGLDLIDLYFGHHKAPIEAKNDTVKVKKKWLKNFCKKNLLIPKQKRVIKICRNHFLRTRQDQKATVAILIAHKP